MNTSNPSDPRLKLFTPTEVAEINATTQDIQDTDNKLKHFKLANYDYSNCAMKLWDKYLLISCKTKGSATNNRILKYQPNQEGGASVDISPGNVNCFAVDGSTVYGGSSISNEARTLFTTSLTKFSNTVTIADQLFKTETLKKLKRIRMRGIIGKDQAVAVYLSFDDQENILAGTVRGNGYYAFSSAIVGSGTLILGTHPLGTGSALAEQESGFFMEMKLTKIPKFRKLSLTLEALQTGRITIQQLEFVDILTYEDRLPKSLRVKQNISVDGLSINNY